MRNKKKHMVYAVIFTACTFCMSLGAVGGAAADDGSVVETVKVTFEAAKGMTTIDDGNVVLFVDYRQGLMKKWLKTSDGCLTYDISTKNLNEKQRESIRLFGERKRLPDKKGSPYPIMLMVAPKPMMTKTVITPQLVWHEFVFQPGFFEFHLATDNLSYKELKEIAIANKEYATIELLDYYDIVSLLPSLGGVPEEGRWQGRQYSYTFVLKSYDEQQKRMDAVCR